jgi:hypothetical protein
MGEREKLAAALGDEELIRYFYLDKTAKEVLAYLDTMKLTLTESQDDVPFNAQVKSYLAAADENGDPWIVKPVASDEEMLYHRACMLAYLLDHETGTLAAPTSAMLIGGKKFRVTKVVRKSVQISSYNYLEAPFINILRADLINRWIFFDEDRNPNNYLVITNSHNKPFLVAIDYDKADLFSETMKITGMTDKFGWLRTEKTRFLTLLRPEHFDGLSIKAFNDRLCAFTQIREDSLTAMVRTAFAGYHQESAGTVEKVTGNIIRRREYVDHYFRSMFKSVEETKNECCDTDYSAFGPSFMAMHNKKK